MRFVHTLTEFGQRIADVRKSVRFAAQREFQILVGQNVKLFQYAVHAALVDGIELIRGCSDGGEAYFVESKVLLQVPENLDYIGDSGRQGHARGNGPGTMILNQLTHFGGDDVVTAAAVGEDAQLVVH